MVRNAYEMAIPEKNRRFFLEKNREKHEKILEIGRQTSFSRSDFFVEQDFLRRILWCGHHGVKPG